MNCLISYTKTELVRQDIQENTACILLSSGWNGLLSWVGSVVDSLEIVFGLSKYRIGLVWCCPPLLFVTGRHLLSALSYLMSQKEEREKEGGEGEREKRRYFLYRPLSCLVLCLVLSCLVLHLV
jgi:hypothetical protein